MVHVTTVTTVTSKETKRLYFDKVYCRRGLARKINSDRGLHFTGAFWQVVHKLLQVGLAMSSSFHPQTDGQTEQANRTLEEMIRHYVSHKQDNWARLLPALEFVYNTSEHRATGKSPFYIYSSRESVKFDEILTTTSSKSPEASERVTDMQSRASAALTASPSTTKPWRPRRTSPDGPRIQKSATTSYCRQGSSSPTPTWPGAENSPRSMPGPDEIVKKVSPVAYELQLPPQARTLTVFHSSLLRYCNADSAGERVQAIPEPICVERQVCCYKHSTVPSALR
jgi:hypothetical protein